MSSSRNRRPLRIAYPISSLRIGGAELRVLALVERLPSDRFEVDFLSLIGEGPLDSRARAAGARVHHLGRRAMSHSRLPVRAAGRFGKLARYARLARSSRYDIIDAWLYPTDVFSALGRFVTKTPIIVAGRADLLPRDAFGPLSGRVDGLVNGLVDAIVANSEIVASATRGQHGVNPAKLHVIRNGVEPVKPITHIERRGLRAKLGAGDADLLIGAVGMLSEVKRHSLLVDAFARLARARSDVRLAIVGEGPMREQLARQVDTLGLSPRVTLAGAIVDIRPLYDAFDIVALSSASEGMPNVLLEAAAAGRPIVTTAAGGATEAVVDGKTGVIVPIEDTESLTAALARVASDSALRLQLGSAAREHVAANFSMERFVSEYCELYERLAMSRGLLPS